MGDNLTTTFYKPGASYIWVGQPMGTHPSTATVVAHIRNACRVDRT